MTLLNIDNLRVWYKTYKGYSKVLDGVKLYVSRGEKVGIVGESGCGKTTTMKTVLRLQEDIGALTLDDSIITFEGENVLEMDEPSLLDFRRNKVSMISQSPMAALNPVFTIGEQMYDVLKYTGRYESGAKEEIREAAIKAIDDVMIADPERILDSYPHQLSGGMRQRICIATALAKPCELLIADEPGTALDVTVQDQIHALLRNLVDDGKRSLIMITHSLGVVRDLVDRIYVMYAGNIVETCVTKNLFKTPLHPYTEGLLASVPRLSGGGLSSGIYGYVPDYFNPPQGCRFSDRCKFCKQECLESKPPLVRVSDDHEVACFKYV